MFYQHGKILNSLMPEFLTHDTCLPRRSLPERRRDTRHLPALRSPQGEAGKPIYFRIPHSTFRIQKTSPLLKNLIVSKNIYHAGFILHWRFYRFFPYPMPHRQRQYF